MQEVRGPALGANGNGTTICFPEQAYCDIFSTSQQDINTNVLKCAEMAVRCVKLTHMELLFREMWREN